ncbi:pantoate--beta-alanine ligase [Nocardioides luteus]|uniref:Pantothenate synthetase n=1 Tax=Nocardioides luteus TaxID=1844 RepID=A0ABQ5SXN8_9ACTN|nr:pantoate--beta-alanine ligase [Nocardioides luteus]MDR7312697.1 pantoate--beta-alanine ligase [Nocardioides luteus]GGR46945.1 pantothenate synthetase [Nocardioides luteus]GLJ68950.1 pantothenate synthetase [Nocardioides luteus]
MTQLASTREELAKLLAPARRDGAVVGFVPTMGALHEGHASLMRVARERVGGGPVVVSIFVNPLQFGAGEDLDRYPRTLEADLEVCEREGVDVVFAPSVDEVYPGGVSTGSTSEDVTVAPGPLAEVLEGKTRPGHFGGVLTVVAKLFGLVRPDVAVFGEKDYQQLALIRRMSSDLCLGVDVVGAPTQREPDGLALSSRNRYLTPDQRAEATTLSQALYAAQREAEHGVEAALQAARAELRRGKDVDLDYLVVTDPALGDLPANPEPGTDARILVAARVGTTRLIDNMSLTIGAPR